MAFPVTLNGTTYTLADFEGTNYVDGFPNSLEDFVTEAGTTITTAEAAQTAAEAAQSAAEAAQSAAETAETNAETAETNAEATLADFETKYLGASATEPTVDLVGDPLATGALFFDSSANVVKAYDGSSWVVTYATLNTVITTVTTTSTSKTLGTGERCHVDTSGQTITLPATPSSGDIVGVVVGDFDDTVVARNGSTIMGAAEDFTIDSAYASVDFQYIGSTWRLV